VPTEAELLQKIERLEQELARQREELETASTLIEVVTQQMPGTYWILDHDLRIIRNGGAIELILGFPMQRFVGKTMYDVIAADPSSGDAIGTHERALAGEVICTEVEYRGKVLAMTIGPYRNSAGEIIGAIGTSLDVTPYRMLERRMVDAQRAESLGVLAGGLAHDFNNLLVAVIGNADLAIREMTEGKSCRHAVENIRIAGLRAAELTEQLLAYAGRGGSGTTRIEPGALVEELLRILQPAMPTNIQVTLDVPEKLAVRGDPAQLRQVLLNLLTNARDALIGRGGAITVRADAVRLTGETHANDVLTATAAGGYVVIEVQDNGPGIDRETRHHLFEPFFTTKASGHGLGLAAVIGIVRAHGGGVRVMSTPGAGATFQIMWPAAQTEPMRAVAQPPVSARTVLVIDDEDLVRDVVARMVEDLGYAAVTARDGKMGLQVVDQQEIDAVLVDLTMPQMSGADVVAELRARRPNLPVVVCSGYDRDSKGPVAADAYLSKPFRIDALERTLAKLLPLRSV
jgi:two-component system cell cycle sensor histidine kinase/response regulator CckA